MRKKRVNLIWYFTKGGYKCPESYIKFWKKMIDEQSPEAFGAFFASVKKARREGICFNLNGAPFFVNRSVVMDYMRELEKTNAKK